MELDRFQVLKSYADSIKTLAEADMRLAQELSYLIIQYWIYWTKPPKETNPIVLALFNQIKIPIDNGKLISKQNSINGKKGWRPEKNWENSQKANGNRKESEPKANQKQTETETISEKKQNIKIKNNKIENNIITLSKDNEEDKSSYGNEEINKCLELIKQYNNGLIDWTQQNQRRFAKHLINKLNQLDSIKDWKYTWQNTLEIILKIISQNKYYSSKITSPEAIYRNLAVLMQQCKNDVAKHNTDNVILETL